VNEGTYDCRSDSERTKPCTGNVLDEPASHGVDGHTRQCLGDEAHTRLHRSELLDILEASAERQYEGALVARKRIDALKSNKVLLYVEAPPNKEDEGEERAETRLIEDAQGEQHGLAALFLAEFPLDEEHEEEDREGE
jgi:hypothetical protein